MLMARAMGADISDRLTALTDDQARLLDKLLAEAAAHDGPGHGKAASGPKAVLIQQGLPSTPLFMVHGSGGRVVFLHAIARHLPTRQPVYGLEAGDGSAAVGDICDSYLEALKTAQPRGPYRIGGYSAGCLIAFALAARLLAMGDAVDFLLFIDPVAVPDARVEADLPLSPHEQLRKRFEIAALAGVTPLSPAFAQVEAVNGQLSMAVRQFQARRLDLRIHLLRATLGDYVCTPETSARWAALAGRGLESAVVEADHFDIIRDPHAEATARQIQAWLDGLTGQGADAAG